MSYKRWILIFVLLTIILLHITFLSKVRSPWVSLPGLIGSSLIIFFAEFIGFFFEQIIPWERWTKAIQLLGWGLLLLDPISIVLKFFVNHVLGFVNS